MLRVSFFKVSGGSLGDGAESSLGVLKYPGDIHFDVNFEVVTHDRVLYATNPVHLFGRLKDIEAPVGTELKMEGSDAGLATVDGEVRGRLLSAQLLLGDAVVGREALLTASAAISTRA
jgi:hypothetical protein